MSFFSKKSAFCHFLLICEALLKICNCEVFLDVENIIWAILIAPFNNPFHSMASKWN